MLIDVDAIRTMEVNMAVSPNDHMTKNGASIHYLNVGRSALVCVANALSSRLAYPGGQKPIEAVLDFGCGHGRVARFLRAAFPEARVDVSELQETGVRWCVEKLGCQPMGKRARPNSYDLIWVGSVFTHLSAEKADEVLAELKASLRPNGVLVMTTLGRWSASRLKNPRSVSEEAAVKMKRDFAAGGYGFAEYKPTPGYGVSMVRPEWYSSRVCDSGFMQVMLQEKAWDASQDVLAFMRLDLSFKGKGPVTKQAGWRKADHQGPPGAAGRRRRGQPAAEAAG